MKRAKLREAWMKLERGQHLDGVLSQGDIEKDLLDRGPEGRGDVSFLREWAQRRMDRRFPK